MSARLTVPGVGAVTYALHHDFAAGTSRFTLTGKRQHGIVTVVPDLGLYMGHWVAPAPLQLDSGRVTVVFGDGPPATIALYAGSREARTRADRLTVNGQRLTGAVHIAVTDANRGAETPLTATDVGATFKHDTNSDVYDPGHVIARVTRNTANRTARILAALIRTWTICAADDLTRLRSSTARNHALDWLNHTADELTALTVQRRELRDREDRLIREHTTNAPMIRALLQQHTEPQPTPHR